MADHEVSAERAEKILKHYEKTTGGDRETNLRDLLADLLHWALREDLDFDDELDSARNHFQAEMDETT